MGSDTVLLLSGAATGMAFVAQLPRIDLKGVIAGLVVTGVLAAIAPYAPPIAVGIAALMFVASFLVNGVKVMRAIKAVTT